MHCTPHRGLGTVVVGRRRIDLSTCLTAKAPPLPPGLATVRVTKNTQSIVFKGKVLLTIHENRKGFPAGSPGPILLEGVSPDRKWVLYSVDPGGSGSIAADGLTLKAVASTGGRSYTVSFGLADDSYRSWCNTTTLVVTAGGDRIATDNKRLIVTGPPDWKPRTLLRDPTRAFGSVACAPDGKSVVVQEQPESKDGSFFHTRWGLWRVRLDGRHETLTTPSAGFADESPQIGPHGSIYFVRSRHGHGKLFVLRDGKVVGPLLSLGFQIGYYGRRDWAYSVIR
jgi:hypothetical protein